MLFNLLLTLLSSVSALSASPSETVYVLDQRQILSTQEQLVLVPERFKNQLIIRKQELLRRNSLSGGRTQEYMGGELLFRRGSNLPSVEALQKKLQSGFDRPLSLRPIGETGWWVLQFEIERLEEQDELRAALIEQGVKAQEIELNPIVNKI